MFFQHSEDQGYVYSHRAIIPKKPDILESMQISEEKLQILVKKYSSKFKTFGEVWDFLQTHPDFVEKITREIDEAILLFNTYRRGKKIFQEEIPLYSSSHLKEILDDDLPSVEKMIAFIQNSQEAELLEKIIDTVSAFAFIDTLRPIEHCAAALLLGAYRSAMLVIHPYLRENNAQVASALEEMLALMAIHGQKTTIFKAVRHWYDNYAEEGFSKELSEAVQNL